MRYTNSEAPEPIVTAKRRDLLAKTLMDFAKILVAATLASKLFGGKMEEAMLAIVLALIFFGLLFAWDNWRMRKHRRAAH